MIGLAFLTIGGTALAVAALINVLDQAVEGGEKQVSDYGRKVENRTREQCDIEAAKTMTETVEAINSQWEKKVEETKAETVEETVRQLRPHLNLPPS